MVLLCLLVSCVSLTSLAPKSTLTSDQNRQSPVSNADADQICLNDRVSEFHQSYFKDRNMSYPPQLVTDLAVLPGYVPGMIQTAET